MTAQNAFSNTLDELNERHGGRIALQGGSGGGAVRFAQLPEHIAAGAAELGAQGGIASDRVVAYVADTPWTAATLFLTLSAHATAAPIPSHATGAEFLALLRLMKPAAVVFADAASPLVPPQAAEMGLPVLIAKEYTPGRYAFTAVTDTTRAKDARIDAGKGGVILTTSGTTGTPKLVALDADRLVAGARNVAATLGLGQDDIGLEIMPLHHIHGLIAGLLAPLYSGGAMNIIQPDRDAASFLATAQEVGGATWYTAVPTMHRAILDTGRADPDLARACQFRLIRSSSSSMPADVRGGLQDLFACPVVEAYGMTEATHQISSQAPPTDICSHGNIGVPPRPPGTLRIADTTGTDLPDGTEGEVLVKSPPTVIRAYLDNPDANARAFTDGWMRTGDIGRINPDGTLSLVGREKEIVKRGGAQVAPPVEVEDALLTQPGVTDAIVFGVDHATLGQDVAAAVVIEPASGGDARQLRAALLDLLSDYKVPSKILHVAEIPPKGPTGKPRRLEMQELLGEALKGTYAAPQSPMEEILVALFEETLKHGPVGRDDDFFLSGGGDSLSGTGLMIQLNEVFDTALSPELLFRHPPTAAELALFLESVDGGRVGRRVAALVAEDHTDHRTEDLVK